MLVAIITIIAAATRFYGLSEVGLGGNDSILYYSLAEQWLKGNFVFRIGDSVEVFRPILLAFNAIALAIFGHSDYAIKLANAALDTMSLLLIAILAWRISSRRTVVLGSVLAYALLPAALWAARQETPHTLSTFLVLSAYLLLHPAFARQQLHRQRTYLFLAGLLMALATLTHEELIFLAAPAAACTAYVAIKFHGRSCLAAALETGLFLLAPVAALLIIFISEGDVVSSAATGALHMHGPNMSAYPEVFGRYFWNVLIGASSIIFCVLVAICIAYVTLSLIAHRSSPPPERRQFNLWTTLLLSSALFYIALSAVFFSAIFPRNFLPLMPTLFICVFYTVAVIGSHKRKLTTVLIVLTACACILSSVASFSAFNVANRRFSQTWAKPMWPTVGSLEKGKAQIRGHINHDNSYYGHWRAVHDALGDRVDNENRLLVLPSVVFYSAGRRALQTDVYLGDNAVFRLDHYTQSLREIIHERDIKYIIFTSGQIRNEPTQLAPYRYNDTWGQVRPIDLASEYAMKEYSQKEEYRQLRKLLEELGAKKLPLFKMGSFDQTRAKIWQLP